MDQGGGDGLIPVHRTRSASAEALSLPGRRAESDCAESVARSERQLDQGASNIAALLPPDTHCGAATSDPGENRDPGKTQLQRSA